MNVPAALRLHDDEQVLYISGPGPTWCLWPLYAVTLGLYSFWRKKTLWVLTNERVVTRKGILNTDERSIPTHYVQDATVKTSWQGFAQVIVTTAGGGDSVETFQPLPKGVAREFADLILATARAERAPQPGAPAMDAEGGRS